MTVSVWEALLLGALVLLVLFWFGPGVRAALRNSRRGTAEDWKGVLLPLGLVVLFVILLIASVR
ncbi:MAG: hypothetical protein WAN46_09930 [Gammaproteobacteria bacterium]|jgi:hypothetical protein